MMIDNRRIVGDLISMKEVFLAEFPQLRKPIKELEKSKNCGTCKRKCMNIIFEDPKHIEKLKVIYGQEEEISFKKPPTPSKMIPNFEHFNIPLVEWQNWFENFSEDLYEDNDKRLHNIVTFHDSTSNSVNVSVMYLMKETEEE